jgi:hypothetical protein
MKTFLLILLLSAAAAAQYLGNSVCLNAEKVTERAILTICNKHTGMAPTPGVRLYLRVYADGSAEYETNSGSDPLVMRKIKVDPANLAEIKRLVAEADLQSADADYPRFRMWTDSGLQTTITARSGDKMKKIFMRNYTAGDKENLQHYPGSLVALMTLTGELWDAKAVTVPPVLGYKGGVLTVGKTYRGKVNFGDAYGMRLTLFPRLPRHHSVMYWWTNVKDFPALDPDKDFGVRTIVFRVIDKQVENPSENVWTTRFTMEIVRVE